jgi:hypothetical protein
VKRVLIPASVLALLFLPVGGIPLVGYVRGVAGDLSTTSLLLLASFAIAFAGGPNLHDRRELLTLAFFVIACAVFLYPMGLGLAAFDPYALGYASRLRELLFGLAGVALFAWVRGRLFLLLAIVLALGAFHLEMLESRNLWDYLLDPWLALYLAGFTIFAGLSNSR